MADSRRQDIIDAIEARFANITTGNGYETSIGSNVSVWRTSAWAASESDGVDIRDTVAKPIEWPFPGTHEFPLMFEIEAVTRAGTQSAVKARKMLADMWKVIAVDRTFGGLVFYLRPVSEQIRVFQDGTTVGVATIEFEAKYRTAAFDPYNA